MLMVDRYDRRPAAAFSAVLGGLVLAVMAGLVVATLTNSALRHRTGTRVGLVLFFALIAVASSLFWWRWGNIRFTSANGTIVIRNLMRSYTLPLAEVRTFGTTTGGSWIVLVTKSGRRIRVLALSTGLRKDVLWDAYRLNGEILGATDPTT